ncbi:uncharacterized protein [Dermacentor albipictus]|uniref:uncharacterized protein isoform X2 n=1 Tax=Dermacentor albipictus TaxID=60249 RepID=UPI0031FE09A5
MDVVSLSGVKNHGKFRVSQFSTPHGSGRIQSGVFYFPLYLRFIFPLDLSPRLALLLVLHSCFQLRWSSVPSVPLHRSTVCAPKDYFRLQHHLFQERLLLLLHALPVAAVLQGWTCLLALHYSCFCTPVFNCCPQAYPARSRTTLRSALQKDYFGHEHHLFQERLLLLLHSLASGVLLVHWSRLFALHYYWFCTPVFNSGPQAYTAHSRTTLRPALQKDYLGQEHHLFQERLLLLLHSLASGVLLVDWSRLFALHYYCFCTPVFNCGPQAYPARSRTTLRSALQKNYLGHEHHLFQERLLLLLHSLSIGVLLVDWARFLALHYPWFCIPVFNCGPQAYPACPCTALQSALQKITSG